MKKTVLICLNPVASHFFPTIGLANALIEQGYRVIYAGFSNLEHVVKSEGFEYLTIKAGTDKQIADLKNKYQFRNMEKLYRTIMNEIKSMIKSQNIAIALFDISRFNIYFLPVFECNIPAISFWTCSGALDINFNIPPNSSAFIPDGTIKGKIKIMSLWVKRYIRREFCKPKTFLAKFFFPHTDLARIVRRKGFKWKYNIDGPYLDLPKLILGPREFEFTDTMEDKVTYLGLCVETRNDIVFNFKEFFDTSKPLIYCSLGTLSHRYDKRDYFFNVVVETFTARPQWNLVMNVGSTGTGDIYRPLPNNILITDYVPQLEILKKADLVLTHGGYGTIKECIAHNVPMIVFPCIYDQPGNAARVEFNEIGIRREIGEISRTELDKIIEQMLTDNKYKKNITQFRDRILSRNYIQEGLHLIMNELEMK